MHLGQSGETIDTNILGSDANLSLRNLAASGIGLNLTIEDTACFMIAFDMRGLEGLEVWVMSPSEAGQRVAGVP